MHWPRPEQVAHYALAVPVVLFPLFAILYVGRTPRHDEPRPTLKEQYPDEHLFV